VRSRLPSIAALVLLVGACSALPGESSSVAPTSVPKAPPASTAPDASDAEAPSPVAPTGRPSQSLEGRPQAAARRLLEADGARVSMSVIREKRPVDPVETLLTGSGRVEPARDRGHIRYDLSGLVAHPSPSPSAGTPEVVEIIWTPDDVAVRIAGVAHGDWQSRVRDEARVRSGLIGRLPDEVSGLLTLVAGSPPDRTVRLEAAELDGSPAERWMVAVPVEVAAGAGVPADVPDADGIRRAYGIEEIEIEVWLVDGSLRRLRLEFRREKAPYGGPDRTTTTYEWYPPSDPTPIELPR
jgi:hypothetical protein